MTLLWALWPFLYKVVLKTLTANMLVSQSLLQLPKLIADMLGFFCVGGSLPGAC